MSENFPLSAQLRDFGMRNLQLEDDLKKIEESGIEIGHISTTSKKEIVDPDLFDTDIRQSAKRMSDYYVMFYCFENTVRKLVKQTLLEKYGVDWWENRIPDIIKKEVKERQEKEKDSVMTIRSLDDPLLYVTLGELLPIIEHNWSDFSDQFRSRKAVRQILSQLNQIRAVVAHNVELHDDESDRAKLSIKDWQRQL
ncbi:MAG: hypothetical protein KGI33_08790 [Thaumarchaeota archaeon]|nr:hypothetical protein [Nitrososphaerota archaeon]